MAALKWDEAENREFETGLSKGVLYPMGDDGYEDGVAWNGLTAVTESPEGAEPTDLWADDMKYATLRSAETFGFTIEAYTYPDEFAECDGTYEPITGLKLGQQKRKAFGFSYVTKKGNASNPDSGYLIHLIYNATASPSEKAYQTVNDSPEAITFSWECDCVPVVIEGDAYKNLKPICEITIDSTKVNSTKLTAFEKTLYGDTSAEPKLPDPDEVITALTPPTDDDDGDGDGDGDGGSPEET